MYNVSPFFVPISIANLIFDNMRGRYENNMIHNVDNK